MDQYFSKEKKEKQKKNILIKMSSCRRTVRLALFPYELTDTCMKMNDNCKYSDHLWLKFVILGKLLHKVLEG